MRLVVYSNGVKAGILDMADSEPFYGFTYDDAYLESSNAMPLSLSLPLREERFDGKHALPFFEGLLPEGDVRASIARQLGISEQSPAKLLQALGKDCAGDVAVLGEDDPYQPPSDSAYAPLEGGLARIAANPYGEISRLRVGNRLSLAGGQEKIALYHDDREEMDRGWYVPLEGSPSTHIIKPQTSDAYPQIALNEYFCMKLAKQVGIETANVSLVMDERPLLLVERYDRKPVGRSSEQGLKVYRRVRQEDFCQALGFTSAQKYETDGGPGLPDLSRALLKYSTQALADREALLRLVLYNYLIGNCDAHAKNYSLLLGKNESVRLAPAYDIVATCIYDGTFGAKLSRGMGMRIGSHSNIDRVTSDDIAQLSRDAGISNKHVESLGLSLIQAMQNTTEEIQQELDGITGHDTSSMVLRICSGIEERSHIFS